MALMVGVLVGTLEASVRLAGWLAIGLVPVVWTLLYLTERMIGRDIWHYAAAYPYRRMEEIATVTQAPRPPRAPEPTLARVESAEIRLVA
jgi:hypothetical protein